MKIRPYCSLSPQSVSPLGGLFKSNQQGYSFDQGCITSFSKTEQQISSECYSFQYVLYTNDKIRPHLHVGESNTTAVISSIQWFSNSKNVTLLILTCKLVVNTLE